MKGQKRYLNNRKTRRIKGENPTQYDPNIPSCWPSTKKNPGGSNERPPSVSRNPTRGTQGPQQGAQAGPPTPPRRTKNLDFFNKRRWPPAFIEKAQKQTHLGNPKGRPKTPQGPPKEAPETPKEGPDGATRRPRPG